MKAVIFDLGNVLIFFDPFRAARRFAREANVPLVKVFAHFFISKAERDYTRGRMTSRRMSAAPTPMSTPTATTFWAS